MADQSRSSEPKPDTRVGPDHGDGMPRWVKLSLIVGLIVALVVVLVLVIGRGEGGHGPGRHSENQPAEQVEQDAPGGHAPPEGGHG